MTVVSQSAAERRVPLATSGDCSRVPANLPYRPKEIPMLEVIQVPGPVVAFQASGTLSGEDYDLMTAELDRQLSLHEKIGVYADMSQFTGFSLPAIAKDLLYTLGKLGELHCFERVSVITNNTWLRVWVQLFWLLVPSSTVRICAPLESDDALAWTSAIESEPPRRALRWIATTRPDVYAFAWNGTITSKDDTTATWRRSGDSRSKFPQNG
jgi:hypothetical protein